MGLALGLVFAHVSAQAADSARAPGVQVRARDAETTAATLATLPEVGTTRAWVFFTDKALFESESAAKKLSRIAADLDPLVAERRSHTLGRGLVDYYDIPVASLYTATLAELGLSVYRQSFWLNAVSVDGTASVLAVIADEPFVQKVTRVERVRLADGSEIDEDMWVTSIEAGDAAGSAQVAMPQLVAPGSDLDLVLTIARSRGLAVNLDERSARFEPFVRPMARLAVRDDTPALFAAASVLDLPPAPPPNEPPSPPNDLTRVRSVAALQRAPVTPTLMLSSMPGKARVRLSYVVPSHFAGQPRIEILDPSGEVLRTYDVLAEDASLTWDGRDADGRALPRGSYGVRLRVEDWIATARVRVQR
jgi:hypothetical protein